jgi:hypothetical protein
MFFIACFSFFPVVMPGKNRVMQGKWGQRKPAVDTKTARLRSIFRTIRMKALEGKWIRLKAQRPRERPLCFARGILERVMGIEPTLFAWEAKVLPLNYTRVETIISSEVTCASRAP